jgi:CO/xanthine dehydrogenase FAD-binding subunit
MPSCASFRFFQGALSVDLSESEMVTEIVLPKLPPNAGWGFEEVSRRSGDFALAAVAAIVTISGGRVAQARIAMTGVAPTPRRAATAETLLIGTRPGEAINEDVIEAVRAEAEPESDLHASADYRRHLVGVLAARAVAAAMQGAAAP